MNDAIEKTIGGLVVAAVSGLGFVAYKHPRAYLKLWGACGGIFALISTAMFGWNLGILTTINAVKDAKITGEKTDQIMDIIVNTGISYWWYLGMMAVAVYFWFLLTFPRWLLEDEPPKKKDNQK